MGAVESLEDTKTTLTKAQEAQQAAQRPSVFLKPKLPKTSK